MPKRAIRRHPEISWRYFFRFLDALVFGVTLIPFFEVETVTFLLAKNAIVTPFSYQF
jgi:hypothetical protein